MVINSASIDDDCLKINYSSSGCSGDSWEVKLIDAGVIMESFPPQRNIKLSLKNEEICEAYFTKEISFDIDKLQVDGEVVLLNLEGFDTQIRYEY
ncbi:hypothetical protein SAMN05444411_10516 [Lutibacter oricola]|uniref:Uncharacterized protein n=1 Tax=Lutibacter oricola TaxID=762486 RepID=A0A1H3B4X3_9FLAO|nr:hypothetical protein [Lutibacter oricola]SDX36738.1 hypothetical protein SAMN05444411_10516 [Lutibacter oricola]